MPRHYKATASHLTAVDGQDTPRSIISAAIGPHDIDLLGAMDEEEVEKSKKES